MRKFIKPILFVWFYLGWFACIFFALRDWSGWTLLFPLVAWLLLSQIVKLSRKLSLSLLLLALIGIIFDHLAIRFGLVTLPQNFSFLLPCWLISMWLLFVSVLPLTQGIFQNKLWLAAVLGSIFGPLSYHSGGVFGVLTLTQTWGWISYGIFWSLYFPLSVLFLFKSLKSENSI